MTIGEDRVRIKFNPSNNSLVSQIKQKSAENARLQQENQTAWNKLEFAEEDARRLRAALKPFADAADTLSSYPDDTGLDLAPITLGDLRAARRALEGKGE